MAQDTFLTAFEQIDRDRDGIIHVEDLELYAQRDGVSSDFVQKWKMLFDPGNTGMITFENFCTTLGVSKKKRESVMRRLNPEPQVYDCNMTPTTKDDALKIIKKNYYHQEPDRSIHPTLMEMDEKLGPRWQARTVGELEKPNVRGEYLIYSLNDGANKYVVWRQPEQSTPKSACCCC